MILDRAEALLDLGRPQDSLAMLATAGEEGESARAHCLRAQAHLALGQASQALSATVQARAVDPSGEWGFRLGAIACLNLGKGAQALPLAEEAVRLAPWEPYTHQVLTIVLLNLGMVPRAENHARHLLELAPDSALGHTTHARVLLALRLPHRAETAARRALAIDPEDAEALGLLADATAAQGRHDEALEARLAAVRADPQDGHQRQALLRRGGLVTGGLVFGVAKVGLFGKVLAGQALVRGGTNLDSAGALLVLALLAAVAATWFGITRFRRRRHGEALPRAVWDGLRDDRRRQDLPWLWWSAGPLLVLSLLSVLVDYSQGNATYRALTLAGLCTAALCVGWQLRPPALADAGRTWRPGSPLQLRRDAKAAKASVSQSTSWEEAGEPFLRERLAWGAAHVIIVGMLVTIASAVGPRTGLTALVLLPCMGGVVADGRPQTWRFLGQRTLLVDARSGRPLGAGRRALRATLRYWLSPVLLLTVACAPSRPYRCAHDWLSRSRRIGLRVSARPAPVGEPYHRA